MIVQFLNNQTILSSTIQNLGYSSNTDFHLKAGSKYRVFGVVIWRSVLHYLIIPSDLSLPYWIPAELFSISDHVLPSQWYFRFLGNDHPSGISILMGYKELVTEETHYYDLIDRKEEAVKVFLSRIDEADNNN